MFDRPTTPGVLPRPPGSVTCGPVDRRTESLLQNFGIARVVASAADLRLFERIRRTLYTPVISDSLDAVGHRDQAMSSRIRPLREDFTLVGRARTVTWMDVYAPDPNPYEKEIEFMDSLKSGDIVVTNTDAPLRNAPWGGAHEHSSQVQRRPRRRHRQLREGCQEDLRAGIPGLRDSRRPPGLFWEGTRSGMTSPSNLAVSTWRRATSSWAITTVSW